MNDKLLTILLAWRAELERRHLPTPPEHDLHRIADSNRVWPTGGLDPVTEDWMATIQYLETQQRFGVVDPIAHMADDMWDPPASSTAPQSSTSPPAVPSAQAPPAATVAEDPQDGAFERLKAWLADAQHRNPGDPNLKGVGDSQLRSLAGSIAERRAKELVGRGLLQYQLEIEDAIGGASAPPAQDVADARNSESIPTDTAEPRVAAERTVGTTAGRPVVDVDPDGFIAYDFTGRSIEPGPLTVSVSPGKSMALSWREPNDRATLHLYRVVAGDDQEPWSPESGRLVAATSDTLAEDTEPFTHAVRHLQVWCNSGSNEREAKLSQPVCIAKRTVVSPVVDATVREEAGIVTGEWDVPEGIERVQVYRVPAERMPQGALSPLHRIHADEDNLGGFQDTDAERGRRYLYQFVTETTVDGVTLTSTPVNQEKHISVVLEPVTDLTVQLFVDGGDQYFDVTWTPPRAGRVVVFRGARPPASGFADEIQDESRLVGANLNEEDRLAPVRRNVEPGRDGLRRVPWPAGWARAYFTPVTVHDGRAAVGTTVAQTRVPAVRDAELVERVNEQLLTFSWPHGAASVLVFVTRRRTEASLIDFAATRHDHEISKETWDAQGGYHFVPPLSRDGCALHLVSVAYQQAQNFRSPPNTVDYPGLRVVRYSIQSRRSKLSLAMFTETPTHMDDLRYALIGNPDRFPLDIHDGAAIPLSVADLPGATAEAVIVPLWTPTGQTAQPGWNADLSGIRGRTFIRLFVDLPPERLSRIAVIDPAISQLSLERR